VITYRTPGSYDPITWVGRVPIYATTIIVALYVVCMVAVAIALASGAEGLLMRLTFDTESVLRHGEIWRCVTYAFVNAPAPWFIIAVVMLYIFGRDVEQHLGRKGFVRLYLGFLLLGPSLLLAAALATGQLYLLPQSYANFAVFLAFASLYPNALLIFQIPAKVFAWVFFGLAVLQLLAAQQLPQMFVFLATAGLAYYAMRHGAALNLDFMTRLRPVSHRTRRPQLRVVKDPEAEEIDPHRIIDPLLEKISRDGMASLTRRERDQLERARAALLARERR
jgi:membrane associated rhomboid family serine protease